jgi:hypothetical protein
VKRILTIIFVCLYVSSFGQLKHPVFQDTYGSYSVGAYGRYQLSSNAISSSMIWQAYQGKFVDRKLREQASNRLFDKNGLGVDLDCGIYARHLPDSAKGIGWYINVADRTHAHAVYTKDFFDIAMFGNAMFAGETANLSDLWLTFITYKQFEAGILKPIETSDGRWHIGLGISFLAGNRNLNFLISKGELYTDPNGEYLEGVIQGSIETASLNSTQYIDNTGLGMSGALSVAFDADRFGIRLDATDMGFIRWSQNLTSTELDSTFHFEGIDVNLFGGDGFANISLDTVVDGFIKRREPQAYSTVTPGRTRLEAYYRLKKKDVQIYAGIQYRIANGYLPYGYVGTRAPLPKGFFIDGRFAYGGYGSWNLGLEIRKRFAKVFEVRLGTNNLEGYVLPMFGTSQSAYISLAGYF